jgi:multicomponent Na+:H+ antiporter subunit E
MPGLLLLFVFLMTTWWVLSGFSSPLLLSLGVVSCLISTALYARFYKKHPPLLHHPFYLGRFLLYLGWLIKEVALSSMSTSLKMWSFSPSITPSTAWIPVLAQDEMGQTILANSITLTPGTATISIRDGVFFIHSLYHEDLEAVRKGTMDRRVSRIKGGA